MAETSQGGSVTNTQGKSAKYVQGFRVRAIAWALAEINRASVWIPRGGYIGARAVVVFP